MKTEGVPRRICDSHVGIITTAWREGAAHTVDKAAEHDEQHQEGDQGATNDDNGRSTNHHDARVGDDSGCASPMGRAVRADPAPPLGPGVSGPHALPLSARRKRPRGDFELATLS